jgi:hypothetical protein
LSLLISKLSEHGSAHLAGDIVAHFKYTVLLMPNGSDRITGHPVQELKPDKEVDVPEIKAWLALGTKSKKKGGGAKKKGGLLPLTALRTRCFEEPAAVGRA